MKKDFSKSGLDRNYSVYVKGLIIEVTVTALFVLLFAFIMYVSENFYQYASVFATISISVGTFFGSMYIARKIGNKGYLIGAITGGGTFLLVTLISLILDSNGITYNTVFHFIIIMLSALIGGIIGVNRKNNRKYI